VGAYLETVRGSDLVAATGAGQLTDSFSYPAGMVLNTLRLAVRRRIPAVLLGQGIGPISDAALLARCRRVLPQVQLISLREGQCGPPILEALGVHRDRIVLTGDDAIESAYARRPAELGAAIGINARVASYARTGWEQADTLRRVVQEVASELAAPLAGIPISRNADESDIGIIQRLLEGFPNVLQPAQGRDPLESAIQLAGRCRVVLTGSYHGAVFALSQGVSAIGLANSPYYAAKFEGLRAQFGAGCRCVMLDHPQVPQILRVTIREAWDTAAELRPQLLNAAARQSELGWQAYRRVFEIVEETC
jgi:colanic acid/amylovoran biosynthesis protein